jgi:hypothetical protein
MLKLYTHTVRGAPTEVTLVLPGRMIRFFILLRVKTWRIGKMRGTKAP